MLRSTVARDGNGASCISVSTWPPALLWQAEGSIASLTMDDAYDGEPFYRAVAARQQASLSEMVIPPRASAAPSKDDVQAQRPRNNHIRIKAEICMDLPEKCYGQD